MTWTMWVRHSHRWLSTAFTATVIANFVVIGLGRQTPWVTYSPLPVLFLMLVSGLYLFVLPYAARRRSGRETA